MVRLFLCEGGEGLRLFLCPLHVCPKSLASPPVFIHSDCSGLSVPQTGPQHKYPRHSSHRAHISYFHMFFFYCLFKVVHWKRWAYPRAEETSIVAFSLKNLFSSPESAHPCLITSTGTRPSCPECVFSFRPSSTEPSERILLDHWTPDLIC